MLFKRTIPVLIAFAVGAWFAIQYFVPTSWSNDSLTQASNWTKVLLGFAYILGLYSLLHLHALKIKRGQPGWGYSVLVFLGLGVVVFFGLREEAQKLWVIATGSSVEIATYKDVLYTDGFQWLYDYIFYPASATMFSILAFFIASAAYRTFRAKSVEAALLMIAAVIVMFGRVPLAGAIHDTIPAVADWIMANPNMAVKRAIMIGVSLGTIATSLRIIFGIERAYLGGD